MQHSIRQRAVLARMRISATLFIILILVGGIGIGGSYVITWIFTTSSTHMGPAITALHQWIGHRSRPLLIVTGIMIAPTVFEAVNATYRYIRYSEPPVFFVEQRK